MMSEEMERISHTQDTG